MAFITNDALAASNAAAIAISISCIALAIRAIRSRRIAAHRNWMVAAFGAQLLFSIGFVTRYVAYGPTPIRAAGLEKVLFEILLYSHEPLAVIVAPLVICTLVLGLLDQRPLHRELARLTLPLWLYVSLSGLALWALLYLGDP